MGFERGEDFPGKFSDSNVLSEIYRRMGFPKQVFSVDNGSHHGNWVYEVPANRGVRIIDAHNLGNHVYHSDIKLKDLDNDSFEELTNYLETCYNAIWVSGFTGEWDIEAVFVAKNLKSFKEFWQKLLTLIGDLIEDYKISVSVKRRHSSNSRIKKHKRKNLSISIFGLDPGTEKLESPDIEILAEISRDGPLDSSHLSERLDFDKREIGERLEHLEMAGIV